MSEKGCAHGPLVEGEVCSACEGLSKTESAIRDEIRRMVAKKENADRTRIEAAVLAGVRAGLEAAKALADAAWEAYDTEWRDAFTVEYARDMEMKKDCIGDLRGQIDGVDAESIAKEAADAAE